MFSHLTEHTFTLPHWRALKVECGTCEWAKGTFNTTNRKMLVTRKLTGYNNNKKTIWRIFLCTRRTQYLNAMEYEMIIMTFLISIYHDLALLNFLYMSLYNRKILYSSKWFCWLLFIASYLQILPSNYSDCRCLYTFLYDKNHFHHSYNAILTNKIMHQE